MGNSKERFQLSLDPELMEWIRDYRYTRIRQYGDVDYTLHQVFIDALTLLRNQTELKVVARPDFVKKNERKKNLVKRQRAESTKLKTK